MGSDYSDVVVVGAGIIGLAVARETMRRHRQLSVTVLEKEATVGAHQTGHNSGVVHGGIYYEPGSLKARLCVDGARRMYDYCHEHGIPYERCGKLIVAIRHDELGRLDALHQRGVANGVPGLRRVTAGEIEEIEPHARGVAALHAPNTGIVDYTRVAEVLTAELEHRGARVTLGAQVTRFEVGGEHTTVVHTAGRVRARRVIVCAGLWADRLARLAGAPADPRIVPFRGAYLQLKRRAEPIVRGMVYPVPDPELPFLGVHVTRHVDGSVSLGPTALLVPSRDGYAVRTLRARDIAETLTWPGTWRMARRFWRAGLTELHLATSRRAFLSRAAEYVPSLRPEDVQEGLHAGVRAQALGRDGRLVDDFLVSHLGNVHFVRNAPSPAATSSLALAAELLDRIEARPST
ncbi:MAG TPA: L-2-hydroxyglutarate oxidase [Intrasporangium sp.]|uniref:L-2-hydroxyglutarate oxidase n=1 Tax=Intrasporangium sp. TaxID=1925024 RepID=UPI002D7980EA|nr:L-2-hydroxyglutarate oxidase [Intrasporangium sp.]HET7399908.1 L-2-hydroxyglutarate oxidase [Intrasporangium sp.]